MKIVFGDFISRTPGEYSFSLNFFNLELPSELIILLATLVTLYFVAGTLKSSRRANELKTAPLLILRYQTEPPSIQLANLNDNLAYRIKVDPFFAFHKKSGAIYKVHFKTPHKNYIASNEAVNLAEESLENGARQEPSTFWSRIVANVLEQPIVIRFTDVQGVKYFTVISFTKGSEKILRAPTKLTFRWKLKLLNRRVNSHYKVWKRKAFLYNRSTTETTK